MIIVHIMHTGPWALADHLTSTVAKVLGVNRPRVTQAACQNALVNVGIDDTYLAKYRVRVKVRIPVHSVIFTISKCSICLPLVMSAVHLEWHANCDRRVKKTELRMKTLKKLVNFG